MKNTTTVDRPELIEALAGVLSRYGSEGASITRLSEATGLKRSSLYHRFPGGKEEIIATVLDRANDRYKEILAPAFTDDAPRQRAKHVADGLNEHYQNGIRPCILIALSVSEEDDRSLTGGCIDEWAAAFTRIAIDAGLTPDDASAVAIDAIGAIQGGLVLSANSGDTTAFERSLTSLPDRLTSPPQRTHLDRSPA